MNFLCKHSQTPINTEDTTSSIAKDIFKTIFLSFVAHIQTYTFENK